VASFAIAGRDRGFDAKQHKSINLAVTRRYRQAMATFAGMRHLDLWYTRLDADEIARRFARQASPGAGRRLQRGLANARTKDSLRAFAKLTTVVDGQARIVGDPPLVVPVEDLAGEDDAQELSD